MKGFVICHKGIEPIAKEEIHELINQKAIVGERSLLFPITNFEDLFLLCYRMQSATTVGLVLDTFTARDTLTELEKRSKNLDLKPWATQATKVGVECVREGAHLFNSPDAEHQLAQQLQHQGYSTDYKHHDLPVFIFIHDQQCIIGIDFGGKDLSKREYKVFVHKQSLKAPLAFALGKLAHIENHHVLVDPFTKSGEIIIEAGLTKLHKSPWYYQKDRFAFRSFLPFTTFDFDSFFSTQDKAISDEKLSYNGYDSLMRNIVAATKNAKIAGILKQINFARIDVDWIDLKFKENSVDRVITQLPPFSKKVAEGTIRKIYDHFFNQSSYIMKPKGTMVIACLTDALIEAQATYYKLKLMQRTAFWQGEQMLHILVFSKP